METTETKQELRAGVEVKEQIREKLFGNKDYSPYCIPGHLLNSTRDKQGWNDTNSFYSCLSFPRQSGQIRKFYPKMCFEVGSWKGVGTLNMAYHFNLAHVIAIDTFLGSVEHWVDKTNTTHDLKIDNGRPAIYLDFLCNVFDSTHTDRITPLTLPSVQAAQVLAHHGIKADFIYIDGDHSYKGCLEDCLSYWDLLNPGGIMAGDDYFDARFQVAAAVQQFCLMRNVSHRVFENNFWYIQKVY